MCLPEHGGAVVYLVEHFRVTASKVLSVKSCLCPAAFPAVFNCEASLIRQVAGALGAVLLGVALSLLV